MIKYLIMDVDGTLTDGKIYIGTFGEMMKAFSIKDGCGIHDILIQPVLHLLLLQAVLLKVCGIVVRNLELQKYTKE